MDLLVFKTQGSGAVCAAAHTSTHVVAFFPTLPKGTEKCQNVNIQEKA